MAKRFGRCRLGVIVVRNIFRQVGRIVPLEQRSDVSAQRQNAGQRHRLGVDEIGARIFHAVIGLVGFVDESIIFFKLLALHAALFKSNLDMDGVAVFGAGLSVHHNRAQKKFRWRQARPSLRHCRIEKHISSTC